MGAQRTLADKGAATQGAWSVFRCELLRQPRSDTGTCNSNTCTCQGYMHPPHLHAPPWAEQGHPVRGATACPAPLMGELCSVVLSPRHTCHCVPFPPFSAREREHAHAEPEGTYRRLGNFLQPQAQLLPGALRLLRRGEHRRQAAAAGRSPRTGPGDHALPGGAPARQHGSEQQCWPGPHWTPPSGLIPHHTERARRLRGSGEPPAS